MKVRKGSPATEDEMVRDKERQPPEGCVRDWVRKAPMEEHKEWWGLAVVSLLGRAQESSHHKQDCLNRLPHLTLFC